ncbi:MAG TPA: hypothetical protein VEB23_05700 [Ramlibacter sp.]|nr:hypothetical protein [Ramlibacter sp.]
MTTKYHPISCSFHDVLESLAITRRPARILFTDADGAVRHRDAVIRDVFSREGAEYMMINSGETLRLDQIVAVDDAIAGDFPR